MNYDSLCEKRKRLKEMCRHLPKEVFENFDRSPLLR